MAIDAVILDLDGTLLDTNPLHVKAWQAAFAAAGYDIGAERIRPQIGKGGDQLVPSLIGAAADRTDGERLRDDEKAQYARLVEREGIGIFPGAEELVRELRRRDLRTALATSSDEDQLTAAFGAAGIDFRGLVDAVTSSDDAEASKPEPDIVRAALERLGVPAARCTMVGDTVWDVAASAAAGLSCLALTCGGTDAETLRDAGAAGVWRDPAHLLEDLDRALALAVSPQPRASLP